MISPPGAGQSCEAVAHRHPHLLAPLPRASCSLLGSKGWSPGHCSSWRRGGYTPGSLRRPQHWFFKTRTLFQNLRPHAPRGESFTEALLGGSANAHLEAELLTACSRGDQLLAQTLWPGWVPVTPTAWGWPRRAARGHLTKRSLQARPSLTREPQRTHAATPR